MAGFPENCKDYFPIQGISDVVSLFKQQLSGDSEPDLTLLSILAGNIENILTVNRSVPQRTGDCSYKLLEPIFPVIDITPIETLYVKFYSIIKGSVDLSEYPDKFATRELVKKVSDVVWGSLSKSYHADKAHLQTLYSLLTGNKLDCFGLAYAVVAGCQILGFNDVHLALSEDHAWVIFGDNGQHTAEITWHGKGSEDKRGQPITASIAEKNWLYLNGQAVICDRSMEVAALTSAINPSINTNTDSIEMGTLQQELLWLLYDLKHISMYPMAIGNLGDLEEISPTPGRCSPLHLLTEAIQVSRQHYNNQHVYPYTYLGGHLFRLQRYKEAIQCWAKASAVIKNYNYNREDEEVYKEFLEIANDLIPRIVKTEAEGISSTSLIKDGEVYLFLLEFYDGICQWEEGSSTPVLHAGWAKNLCSSLAKFDPSVREHCQVRADGETESDEEVDDKEDLAKAVVTNIPKTTPDVFRIKNGTPGSKHEDSECIMGSGDPLSTTSSTVCPGRTSANSTDTKLEVTEFLSSKSHSSPFPGMTIHSMLKAESPADMVFLRSCRDGNEFPPEGAVSDTGETTSSLPSETLVLYSQKMKGLRNLLTTKKLNAPAIQLHLTAQSQTTVRHNKRNASDQDFLGPRKRTRRD